MSGYALMPQGECWVTRDGDSFTIDRADPRILVSDQLVTEFRRGNNHPDITLDGDVLTARGKNRTVVYRLVEHVPEWHAWIAQWPD